ncbi:MAG: DnaB-like helicase C-terminal domain-containing protein [Planctomycetota bacterium]|nr:DnaB-like helicase C-terminal domain-containing protein [Planctomycetota bacterium]
MEHLGTLLASIPLPDEASATSSGPGLPASEPCTEDAASRRLLTELGADLPAGHLHVWGGPSGSGKTSLLLSLLHGAAAGKRPVVYATYDLPASTLAIRLLAMLANVDAERVPDPGAKAGATDLDRASLARLARVRDALADLPFYILSARGFSVGSLADRIVRAPVRPQVLVVDYVQAVIRERGTEIGESLRALSGLAVHQHLAVVGVFRADTAVSGDVRAAMDSMERTGADLVEPGVAQVAARVGWIMPVEPSAPDQGTRRVEVLSNRYGRRASVPVHIDPTSGRVEPVTDEPRPPAP